MYAHDWSGSCLTAMDFIKYRCYLILMEFIAMYAHDWSGSCLTAMDFIKYRYYVFLFRLILYLVYIQRCMPMIDPAVA